MKGAKMKKKVSDIREKTPESQLIGAAKKCADEYGLVYTLGLLQFVILIAQRKIEDEVDDMMEEANDE
jgi:hypothetical protein